MKQIGTISKELYERYELFLDLKDEMDKIYRYKWPTAVWNGTTEWRESTDRLSDILYKLKEHWIERPELIEEVK